MNLPRFRSRLARVNTRAVVAVALLAGPWCATDGVGLNAASTPRQAPAALGRLPPPPGAALIADPPIPCEQCDEWNAPRTPFKVFGNTWFVGTQGLSSVLITTDAGLILVDAALPQSVPRINASIEALGFRAADVRFILTSHAHFDHVGGVRAMQRATGATVLASASTARALALGHPVTEDPQFGTGALDVFPSLTEAVRVMRDGETLRVRGTTITAHHTPGHTPGATTWTWQSCEGARCLNMVYADSLTPVAKSGYRFTATPESVEAFRRTIRKVSALPCDIVLSTHPGATGMDEKVRARAGQKLAPGAPGDPFVAAGACTALADRAMGMLDERLRSEAASARH